MDSASTKKTARLAGLLYLTSSLIGVFGLIYIPKKLVVPGDAAATAARVRDSGSLFRLGLGAELLGFAIFVLVALVLYRLFRPVAAGPALWMMVLILVSIPITFAGVVSEIAALNLAGGAGGPDFLSVFDRHQRDALAYLCLRLHTQGFIVAQIFWGLWLFPFGVCVIRSGFIPRILGYLLMVAGCSNVVNSITSLVFPQYSDSVRQFTSFLNLGEPPIIFWLLIWGAKPQRIGT